MSIKKTVKLTLLTSALAATMGLTGCDKKAEETPEPDTNADVPMSAEPAENNEPAIVADDLDEVDAQLEATEAESVEATESEPQAPAQ